MSMDWWLQNRRRQIHFRDGANDLALRIDIQKTSGQAAQRIIGGVDIDKHVGIHSGTEQCRIIHGVAEEFAGGIDASVQIILHGLRFFRLITRDTVKGRVQCAFPRADRARRT